MSYIDCEKCYHFPVCKGDTDKHNYFGNCPHYKPTADVVEVRHGEWELHGNDDDLGSTYWCSHCRYQVDEELFYPNGYAEEKPYKFCPNCGAKMDGERSEK